MNASTAKILGIILVVLVVFFAVGAIRFLFFAPAGVFHGWNGWPWPHFDRWHFWVWPWVGFAGLFGLAAFVFWIVIIVWVYRDAESRRMNGAIWALVAFFLHFLGLIVYLLVRSGHPAVAPPAGPAPAACPQCGKPVGKDQAYCASCGQRLRPACPKCGAGVQPGWKACPACGEKI
jgi:hypothetical protein